MQSNNPFYASPYWPIVDPFFIGDVLPDPYRVGDFPILRDDKRKDACQKGLAEILKNLQVPGVSQSVFDKQVWFNSTDGGQTFRLEVVGYGQEHISAEIKDSTLHISGKRGQKSFSQQYAIPSPERLDLTNITAKVEHGLLEINFAAKKVEQKTIKVL